MLSIETKQPSEHTCWNIWVVVIENVISCAQFYSLFQVLWAFTSSNILERAIHTFVSARDAAAPGR